MSYKVICMRYRADSKFVPSQWETTLLCNNVSHWLGANLESTTSVRRGTHCGLVTPYGDIYLGRHIDSGNGLLPNGTKQAITWTNTDLSSMGSVGIQIKAIPLAIPYPSIVKVSFNITQLKFQSSLPGANGLTGCNRTVHSTIRFIYNHALPWWTGPTVTKCTT